MISVNPSPKMLKSMSIGALNQRSSMVLLERPQQLLRHSQLPPWALVQTMIEESGSAGEVTRRILPSALLIPMIQVCLLFIEIMMSTDPTPMSSIG
jgi:hypothetical protein